MKQSSKHLRVSNGGVRGPFDLRSFVFKAQQERDNYQEIGVVVNSCVFVIYLIPYDSMGYLIVLYLIVYVDIVDLSD